MKPASGSNSRHDRLDAASAGPRSSLPQLSIPSILGIWAAAALPMAALGWLVSPGLSGSLDRAAGIPGTTRIFLMTVGLVWQFIIVLLLVRHEAGSLSWSSRERQVQYLDQLISMIMLLLNAQIILAKTGLV